MIIYKYISRKKKASQKLPKNSNNSKISDNPKKKLSKIKLKKIIL